MMVSESFARNGRTSGWQPQCGGHSSDGGQRNQHPEAGMPPHRSPHPGGIRLQSGNSVRWVCLAAPNFNIGGIIVKIDRFRPLEEFEGFKGSNGIRRRLLPALFLLAVFTGNSFREIPRTTIDWSAQGTRCVGCRTNLVRRMVCNRGT